MRVRVIVIAGPTCVGKTKLAIRLAEEQGGEIVSADSMQVYRYMDIGTAKPTAEEQRRVTHHLIDVVDPDEDFNAAIYRDMAAGVIDRLEGEGRRIFVVGGTGLYLQALLGGLLQGPGADKDLRARYRDVAERNGTGYLYGLLQEKDAAAARKIHPHDAPRIIRALEYFDTTGASISRERERHGFHEHRYDCLKIGLIIDRSVLYEKIEERTDRMIAAGLVGEVEELLARGYDEETKPMQTMYYRYVMEYIRGKTDMAETVRLLKRDTRRYAKRQMTWFQRDDAMLWHDPGDFEAVAKAVANYLL